MTEATSTNRRKAEVLIWLIPIVLASLTFLASFSRAAKENTFFYWLEFLFSIVAPIGGFWGIYCCVRYERKPLKYIAIVIFVPLGFLWYYFERYRRSARVAHTIGIIEK